jgi:hypothetical protein
MKSCTVIVIRSIFNIARHNMMVSPGKAKARKSSQVPVCDPGTAMLVYFRVDSLKIHCRQITRPSFVSMFSETHLAPFFHPGRLIDFPLIHERHGPRLHPYKTIYDIIMTHHLRTFWQPSASTQGGYDDTITHHRGFSRPRRQLFMDRIFVVDRRCRRKPTIEYRKFYQQTTTVLFVSLSLLSSSHSLSWLYLLYTHPHTPHLHLHLYTTTIHLQRLFRVTR